MEGRVGSAAIGQTRDLDSDPDTHLFLGTPTHRQWTRLTLAYVDDGITDAM